MQLLDAASSSKKATFHLIHSLTSHATSPSGLCVKMSVAGRRSGNSSSSTAVELVLLPNLKNCLLNLPASLVALLLNSNTIAQNVVVELQYRQPAPAGQDARSKTAQTAQSIYLGWTGMQSQTKLSPLIGRDGIRGSSGRGEQEVSTVEVDATLARRLGLSDGMKVSIEYCTAFNALHWLTSKQRPTYHYT
jgi:peroxin-1